MAILGKFTDAVVIVNGVTLSDHAAEVTVESNFDENDITTFGSNYKIFSPGLGDATITIRFFQDFAAAKVDATIQPLNGTTTPFLVQVRPTSGAISSTNPEYQLTCLNFTYSPIAGAVGAPLQTTCVFRNGANTGLVRDVTP